MPELKNPSIQLALKTHWLFLSVASLGLLVALVGSRDLEIGLIVALLPVVAAIGLYLISRPNLFFILFVLLVAAIPQVPDEASITGTRYTFAYAFKLFGGLSLMDTVFVVMVISTVALRLLFGRVALPRNMTSLALVGLVGTTVLGLFTGLANGNDPRFVGYEFLNINRFWVVYLLARMFLDDRQQVSFLSRGILGIGIALGLLGAIKYALGLGVDLYGTGQKLPIYDSGVHLVFVWCFLGLFDSYINRAVSTRKTFLILVALVPALWTFVFSFRRGLWVCLAVALGVMLLLAEARARQRFLRPLVLTVGIVSLGFVVALQVSPQTEMAVDLLWLRVSSIINVEDPNNLFRYYDTLNALHAIGTQPLLGLGLGSFYPIVYGDPNHHAYRVAQLNSVSHNTYLYLPMKLGIPGFVFFVVMVGSAAVRGMRVLRDNEVKQSPPALMAVSFVLGYLVFLATAPGLLFMTHAVFFGLAMAYIDWVENR